MKRRFLLPAAAMVMAAVVGPSAGAGSAATPNVGVNPAGVQTAPACLLKPDGSEQCFQSAAAEQDTVNTLVSEGTVSCYVTLYSGASYTGSTFTDTTVDAWVNLSNYGFADVAVSFKSGGCLFHLAKQPNGIGNWYPGNTDTGAICPDMGSGWDYAVQSVDIA